MISNRTNGMAPGMTMGSAPQPATSPAATPAPAPAPAKAPAGTEARSVPPASYRPSAVSGETQAALARLRSCTSGTSPAESIGEALASIAQRTVTTSLAFDSIPDDGSPASKPIDVANEGAIQSVTLTLAPRQWAANERIQVSHADPTMMTMAWQSEPLASKGAGEIAFEIPGHAFMEQPAGGSWTVQVLNPAHSASTISAKLEVTALGAAPVPETYTAPPHYEDKTADQLKRLTALHKRFMTDDMLKNHEAWHDVNGPGGTQGAGSGNLFLLFHHEMMLQFQRFLKDNGGSDLLPMPIWDPMKAIPEEVAYQPRDSNNPAIPLPSWLTLEGGHDEAPGDITGVKSLKDVKSVDDLGRILGTSGYHATGHEDIGGTMATFASPADPVFFGWHGHIDDLLMKFLYLTENGRTWMKSESNRRQLVEFQVPPDIARAVQARMDNLPPNIATTKEDYTDAVWRAAQGYPPLPQCSRANPPRAVA